MKLRCSEKTYNAVKEKNIEIIKQINQQIGDEESIIIEAPEEVTYNNDDPNYKTLTEEQLEIITSYIKERLFVNPKEVNKIRDIALKIKANQDLDLSDALDLMKVAEKLRPNGSLIRSKVKEMKKELGKK